MANYQHANGSARSPKTDDQGAWSKPLPLDERPSVPAFPIECLPDWLGKWVAAVADATQTPPDLAGMLALAVIGAALAVKYRVHIRDGWSEPTNLFVVVALPPGERKSAVFADVIRPVQFYEAELTAEMAPEIAKRASDHRMIENRLKEAEKRAGKAVNPEQYAAHKAAAEKLAEELAAHDVPELPQMFCDDETPENLGKLLARHEGRMMQASAEGTAFEVVKGKYSDAPNFDVYLKGHAGDPLRVGRISRERDIVDHPALSVALAVQPDVIQGLADHASMRGRGFLARWCYSLPESRVGRREVARPPVPAAGNEEYMGRMLELWRLPGAKREDGKPAPRLLRFSQEAENWMQGFEMLIEPRLAEGADLGSMAGWANKLAGTVARLAAILHLADGNSWEAPVNAATVKRAEELGNYLLEHAQAAFGLMGADARVTLAYRILKWLTNSVDLVNLVSGESTFTVSQKQIHTALGGATCTPKQLTAALNLLAEHYYLRPIEEAPRPGPGRKRSPRFEVNPHFVRPQY